MKLHWSPTSPFVRKVMIAAHELGVADKLDRQETTPQTILDDVAGDNPLAMIPTLITDEGETLFDSWVILSWLNHTYGGDLIPAPGPEGWRTLRRHALAHGLIESANARFHEHRRPEEVRWDQQEAKLIRRINLVLDGLERDAAALDDGFTVFQIAAGAALGYIDLRFPGEDWREGRPELTAWFARVSERPSMKATAPPKPQ